MQLILSSPLAATSFNKSNLAATVSLLSKYNFEFYNAVVFFKLLMNTLKFLIKCHEKSNID